MRDVADTFLSLKNLDLQARILDLWKNAAHLCSIGRVGNEYASVISKRIMGSAFREWSMRTQAVERIRDTMGSALDDLHLCILGEALDLWRQALELRRIRKQQIQEALEIFRRNRERADLLRFLEDAREAVRARDEALAKEAANKVYLATLGRLRDERERILVTAQERPPRPQEEQTSLKAETVTNSGADLRPADLTSRAGPDATGTVEDPAPPREYVVPMSRRAPRVPEGVGTSRTCPRPEPRATVELEQASRLSEVVGVVGVTKSSEAVTGVATTGAKPQFSEKEVALLQDCVEQYRQARARREELRERHARLLEEAGTLRAELGTTLTPAAVGLQLEALTLEIEEVEKEEATQSSTVEELKQLLRKYKEAM